MSAARAYRRFLRAYRWFHRSMLWVWFGGIGLCLVLTLLGLGKPWAAMVGAFVAYPVIVGWLFFNGSGILIRTLHRLSRQKGGLSSSAWIIVAVLMMVGISFAALSIVFLVAFVRGLIT